MKIFSSSEGQILTKSYISQMSMDFPEEEEEEKKLNKLPHLAGDPKGPSNPPWEL